MLIMSKNREVVKSISNLDKVDLNTGEIIETYKLLADAGRENGLHDTNIHKVLHG